MSAIIRPIRTSDRDQWDSLWQGYLTFYKEALTPEQTELTWMRLLDKESGIHGLVAELDGKLLGLAHYSFTHSTWSPNRDLYLEDLFVIPEARAQGLGRALILALDEAARESGSQKIWWETREDNATARKLYDSLATLSEFVKYERHVPNIP